MNSSSDESDLCVAYEWITINIDDYVSETVLHTCLQEVEPESDIYSLMELLAHNYTTDSTREELPRKAHFALLFMDKLGLSRQYFLCFYLSLLYHYTFGCI